MNKRVRTLLLTLVIAGSTLPGSAGAQRATDPRVGASVLEQPDSIEVIARFATAVPHLPVGARLLYRFESIPAVHLIATPEAVRALVSRDDLVFIQRDAPVALDLDSATIASRAKNVWAPKAPAEPITVDGKIVDGSGVGIAVVDSGLDGLHPDFQVPGKVGGNFIVTEAGVQPAPYTATASAHGTHVAGIAAGNGAASDGLYRGAAPGATLYAFGMGVATVIRPAIAFDWILAHGAQQDPAIRVLNNSWHCTGTVCESFNPDSIQNVLATRLTQEGVTITWASGNDGGDGSIANTAGESINPAPGIIGVANYDDSDRGARTGCLSSSSSRGAALVPSTWPDLAAPGRVVTSTWALGPTYAPPADTQNTRSPDGDNNYRQLSGTSMAAPHVAGIVALMLQARPSLTPAQIEYILKSTATKLTCTIHGFTPRADARDPVDRVALPYAKADPAHPYDGATFFDGHGLVDAIAAVEAGMSFDQIPPPPPVEALPEPYERIQVGVEVERTLYLRSQDGLSEEPPTEDIGARVLLGDAPVTFTSEPLDALNTSGLLLGLWFGTSAEYQATYLGRPTTVHSTMAGFQTKIERVDSSGAHVIVDQETRLQLTYAMAPVFREFVLPMDDAIAFEPGDRLRLTLNLRSDLPNDEAKLAWALYSDAASTPSQVALGRAVAPVLPGTSMQCQVRIDCVEVGGARQTAQFDCDIEGAAPDLPTLRVTWTGPAGSTGGAQCQGAVITCTIPGRPPEDPWGTCKAEVPMMPTWDTYETLCFYLTADGGRADGVGRCDQTPPSNGVKS